MSRSLPPLNPLKTFEAAARHLSFTRAAEELFVTAAAVSHQIKTLEESLGVQLFARQAKSLVLTDAGSSYLPGIQRAFKQMAEATHQLHLRGNPTTLRINIPPTFAVKWLIPRMDRFMKEHPEIDLKVSTSAKQVDFDREDFDLAVRYGRGVYPGLHAELCLPVEVFPVCSPALLDGAHPLREPADLKHHTLLHDDSVYTDVSNPDWAMWLEHAGVSGVDAKRGPSFWPSYLVINAAIDGLGVALAKKNWVEQDLAQGRLVRPFDVSLPVEFSYYLVYPERRAEDPLIAIFVHWVRSEVARENAARAQAATASICP
jgi:LysR family transcriptional regulator, glycine cleavage system transcriptional activator